MASDVRITLAVARVLREFLTNASQPRHGYDLMQATGYPSGKLYPILGRLTGAGWLTRNPEEIDPSQAGRPARYLYRLTEDGAVRARQEIAVLTAQFSASPPRRLRPQGEGSGA
jgi:DNA-binding PadR family transcriptional regulator